MAVAIPLIASFASVSAGVAAGIGTLSGFAMVAGGVLTGVGALTGKKDLMKIGGVLSLGGAVGGMANAASSAGSSAAGATGGSAGSTGASTAKTLGAEALSTSTPSWQIATAEPAGLMAHAQSAQAMAPLEVSSLGSATPSLAQRAGMMAGSAGSAGSAVPLDAVGNAASKLTSADMNTYLSRAWDKIQGAGNFIRDNKELVQLGGNALASAYGPDAERLDWQRSLYERQMHNLNNPVALGRT